MEFQRLIDSAELGFDDNPISMFSGGMPGHFFLETPQPSLEKEPEASAASAPAPAEPADESTSDVHMHGLTNQDDESSADGGGEGETDGDARQPVANPESMFDLLPFTPFQQPPDAAATPATPEKKRKTRDVTTEKRRAKKLKKDLVASYRDDEDDADENEDDDEEEDNDEDDDKKKKGSKMKKAGNSKTGRRADEHVEKASAYVKSAPYKSLAAWLKVAHPAAHATLMATARDAAAKQDVASAKSLRILEFLTRDAVASETDVADAKSKHAEYLAAAGSAAAMKAQLKKNKKKNGRKVVADALGQSQNYLKRAHDLSELIRVDGEKGGRLRRLVESGVTGTIKVEWLSNWLNVKSLEPIHDVLLKAWQHKDE